MSNQLTPYDDRYCPIYKETIDGEICYETALCMKGMFKLSSVPESENIKMPTEEAKKICLACEHSCMD